MAKLQQKQTTRTVMRTKPEDKDLRAETLESIETINKSWFIVYKNLYAIEEARLYEEWGYESMEAYVKDELGLEYRSMRQKVQVGKVITMLGLTTDQIEGITEWTKFKALIPLLSQENITQERVDSLLRTAKEKSFRDLQEFVQTSRTDHIGGRMSIKHKLIITLIDEQKNTVDGAMAEAKTMTGFELPGQLIEYICMEWMLNHSQDPAFLAKMSELMALKEGNNAVAVG